MKRYEALADDIAQSIRAGVLRAGDRVPSVRQTSAKRNISPSTVFQAYYLLEAQGLIRARECFTSPAVRNNFRRSPALWRL
jgi:DNA-binding transcriptional MocR family regulator